jgi:biopolymer transport protein ExbB
MNFKQSIRGAAAALLAGVVLSSTVLVTAPAMAQTPPAATAAMPVAPQPPAAAPATETLDNPYGIDALWRQGDFVSKGTLIILVIMSLGSWYIGILKLLEQQKLFKQAKESDEKFWHATTPQEGLKALDEDSAFKFIAEKGAYAAEHHASEVKMQLDLTTWVDMTIERAIDIVSNRLQNGLAFLATVGSTAPFVGLFGTVWGIYHALTAIGIAGQASIDKVAGPVGESLIMTAMGLAVAVPAVLGYNWLVRRNKVAMELVRHFSGGVHMILLSGGGGGRRRRAGD